MPNSNSPPESKSSKDGNLSAISISVIGSWIVFEVGSTLFGGSQRLHYNGLRGQRQYEKVERNLVFECGDDLVLSMHEIP